MKDSSQKTALDYATEKGLHYCSLLLTKTEGLMEAADRCTCSHKSYNNNIIINKLYAVLNAVTIPF